MKVLEYIVGFIGYCGPLYLSFQYDSPGVFVGGIIIFTIFWAGIKAIFFKKT